MQTQSGSVWIRLCSHSTFMHGWCTHSWRCSFVVRCGLINVSLHIFFGLQSPRGVVSANGCGQWTRIYVQVLYLSCLMYTFMTLQCSSKVWMIIVSLNIFFGLQSPRGVVSANGCGQCFLKSQDTEYMRKLCICRSELRKKKKWPVLYCKIEVSYFCMLGIFTPLWPGLN